MNKQDILVWFTVIFTLLFFGFVICQSVYYDYLDDEININEVNATFICYNNSNDNFDLNSKLYININRNIYTTKLDELVFEITEIHPELKIINISRNSTEGGCWYRLSELNCNNPIGYDQFAHYNGEVLWFNISTNDIDTGWYKIYSFHGLYISEYINNTKYYKPI